MKTLLVIAVFAMLFGLSGVTPALAKGDTLTVGISLGIKSLDPHTTTQAFVHTVLAHINETLVGIEGDSVVPLLAESWELLDDKRSYRFTLKQGVKFHNGEVMTADDVVFSFKRASGQGAAIKAWSSYLSDVEKVDDRTVILRTARPLSDAFLGSLGHPWASILNKKAVISTGQDYGTAPVGTGKFRLRRLVTGDRVELERFDDYHADKAKVKNLTFRTFLEATSRTIELESGSVDVVVDVPPVDISRIKENPDLEIVAVPSWRNYHIGLNLKKAPYDNIKVRQAINLAVNRPGIVKVVFRGYAEPARGPVPSIVAYSDYKNSPDLPYDPEKAKKLLAEAGFPNGFKSGFIVPERSDFQNIATILQSNLRDVGIDLKINIVDYGNFADVARQPDHDPFVNNWGNPPTSNPFFAIDPLIHSKFIGQTNRFFYSNPKVDALLEKGVAVTDKAEKTAIYKEVWDILNVDLPMIPLLAPSNIFGKTKSLKGVTFSSSLITYYGNGYFE
ncbi:MAG: ABC transporter substrate-binding protein [Desulfovibrio sp.]|jgi:peptide/nickel transport system substrate-binding protein|nr:ABC transporter substrate-binding protein [Desulfovibrio sp.]